PVIGSEPINPAVINSVTILRQGEFANSWDPSQYWIAPEFSEKPFNITNNIEDTDDDGTPDTRILQGKWTRDPNNIYFLGQSNDLDNWTQITYDRQLFVPGEEPREEVRFLPADLLTDRRHFYSLLEAKLPAISDLDGKRLTLDINPVEDVNEDFVTYQPETFVVDFYDELDGGWKLKRSDSDMQPIGNVGLYRQFPIGWRTQVHLQNSGFSEMQVYLNYNDNNRNTGDAHIYYVNGRNEGNLVSGTFTLTDGQPRRELQDKNLTRLTIQVTNDETDPVTTTYTLDLWDNFTEEAFNTLFEGGYKIERTNTEFIQQGRIIYQWVEVDGQTYVNIDLDTGLDFQTVLSDPTQSSGTAKIFYPGLDQFFDGTFTLGEGTPRPDPIDQAGNKLILTLDLSGENTDPVQSKIDIDFYEAAQDEDGNDLAPGGYEATRTDSEVNQFGDVFVYEWYEQGGETRVDLSFDIIQPMQAYLTFTSGDSTSGGSGTAKIHYPQFGTVGEATFEYVVGGGTPRPVSVDKSGTQLEIQLAAEVVDILTIDLYTATTGLYRTTRQDSEAQPTGEVLDYQWYERPNGDQLILIDYD
ncbi:MAG: hypothetical protein KJT03_20315, partial [Verrucomicrobiae bacterium]|nr:hypothetical protein [Verrucomicrobiae bacterium]